MDAGAIVAFLHKRDQWNSQAVKLFSELPKPFFTCESVISEAFYLTNLLYNSRELILGLLGSGMVRLDFILANELPIVIRLLEKYKDVPMSLADACLVRMSELEPESLLLTFDSDFQIYRRNRRDRISTLPAYEE